MNSADSRSCRLQEARAVLSMAEDILQPALLGKSLFFIFKKIPSGICGEGRWSENLCRAQSRREKERQDALRLETAPCAAGNQIEAMKHQAKARLLDEQQAGVTIIHG